jgi:hypothetical protein
MIIKGGSRGAPAQLAWHLQRRDTNERIEILELQSPAPNLKEAFRDWQTLVEGTRGFKGLYHANIDPAKDYTMTREQWLRSVEVLEKELGLEGQPRAVVMHEKHGREHIHVVWARTDIDRMVLRSDSQNYLAHERASQALELEFGHEKVPGKHAKRDREKQPEFPKADANQAEWQQGERTGIDAATRKEQITALKQTCDNGQSFKTALEEQGYILAKGDRRDFVIVDETGSIHSLGRQIKDMKAAELRAFMKDVDRETLPTAAEAVEIQRQRQEERHPEERQQDKPPEQTAQQQEHQEQDHNEAKHEQKENEQHEPEPHKDQQQKPEEQGHQENEHKRDQRQQQEPQQEKTPEQTESKPDPLQAEAEAIRKAVTERQAEERRRLIESQRAELDELRHTIDLDTQARLDRFDAGQKQQAEARLQRQQAEAPTGIAQFISSVQDFIFPERAAQREVERQREQEQFTLRQRQERDDYAKRLQETNDLEIENVTQRQALRLQDHETKGEGEIDRYLRELEASRQLQAEIEERERQRAEELARDGPERPPPRRAR